MSTHAATPPHRGVHGALALSSHVTWLAAGFAFAFAAPFVLTDVFDVDRDAYYGIYAVGVIALFAGWARSTHYDLAGAVRRRLLPALGLGAVAAAVLAVMVVRTAHATARPHGATLVGAVLWRGVVYGATDGLLLSVFPVLVVFAALAGSRLRSRLRGTVLVGAVALVASLALTAVYHVGYADFRSEKLRKPLVGDVVWSIPTLATLNPVGAPIAHVGLHTSAVLHSYGTDTFLPPHR